MPGSPGPAIKVSLANLFKNNKLIQWWNQPKGPSFGAGSLGGLTEQGQDFNMPFNSPVGSLTDGRIVYVGNPYRNDPNHSSLGYVVQVQNFDGPNGSPGSITHYQHLQSVPGDGTIAVGQIVGRGQIIGYSGGCAVGSSAGNCITDQWSSGPHIEVRWSPAYDANSQQLPWGLTWKDPLPYIKQQVGPGYDTLLLPNGTPQATDTGTPSSQFTSANCAPWDIACLLSSAGPFFRSWAIRVGLFLLGILLLIFGFLLLLHPDSNDLKTLLSRGAA